MPRCWPLRLLFCSPRAQFHILRLVRPKPRRLGAGIVPTALADASSEGAAAVAVVVPAAARVEEQGEDEERHDQKGEAHGGSRLFILDHERAPCV